MILLTACWEWRTDIIILSFSIGSFVIDRQVHVLWVSHFLIEEALGLQVHLLEGVIDQVDGIVRVSWVHPRVLGIPQITALKDRLDNWLQKVHTTLLAVEAETPDLIAA